ncbi:isopentenyl-diphosphate Delta-isomerase [Streptomyces sp. NPDC029080]|uniref:isopentenyl-diphosphate Delta-isomerase n=1 Tax=Streptomyces sp. NPDC029080 TaxID=3155017 RepID=UPI0033CBCB62
MTAAPVLLEVVTPQGETIGEAEKLSVHRQPGTLHRAFSVFLFAPDGRMLLQRRALTKYHSAGVWSNTCCGHPHPGEDPAAAATRRTREELGLTPRGLRAAGTVVYHHADEASGLVEHEYNHLFVGVTSLAPQPDPAEVHETALVDAAGLGALRRRAPFSAWFPTVLAAALPEIRRTAPAGGW